MIRKLWYSAAIKLKRYEHDPRTPNLPGAIHYPTGELLLRMGMAGYQRGTAHLCIAAVSSQKHLKISVLLPELEWLGAASGAARISCCLPDLFHLLVTLVQSVSKPRNRDGATFGAISQVLCRRVLSIKYNLDSRL